MSNIINLNIEADEQKSYGPYRNLNIKSDKPLYDPWDEDKGTQETDYEISVSSLTELYSKLYDISQSQDIMPKNVEFHIDGEVFCKIVGGFHLAINEKFSNEIVDKYAARQEIDFSAHDEIYVAYGENKKLTDTFALKTDTGEVSYNDRRHSYILNSNGDKEFPLKEKDNIKDIIKNYLEDPRANVNSFDKIVATFEGKDIGLEMLFGKEIKLETSKEELKEENKQKKRSKNRPR